MKYNPFMSKIDAMGIAHQQHIDRMAARDDFIERRQIELYDDMEKGREQNHLARLICEVVDEDMADLIRELAVAYKDTDDRAQKLWGDLQSEMTDYSLRIAEYEADHPPKEEV